MVGEKRTHSIESHRDASMVGTAELIQIKIFAFQVSNFIFIIIAQYRTFDSVIYGLQNIVHITFPFCTDISNRDIFRILFQAFCMDDINNEQEHIQNLLE